MMTVGTKKILVIDDEPDTRMLLNRRLASYQYHVLEAADGHSGVEVAKQEQVDLIILDVMMPDKDGFQAYEDLRKDPKTQSIPVIFLTALSGNSSLTEHGLGLMALNKHGIQMDNYFVVLGKPYDPQQLLREIRRLLGEGNLSAR